MNNPIHRFYRFERGGGAKGNGNSGGEFRVRHWRPSVVHPFPPGQQGLKFLVWFVFDKVGVFRRDGYSVCLVEEAGSVVHRSCVFPRFFRFPFMGRGDLQVGDTWTAESARGKGLATHALKEICRRYQSENIDIWYLVEDANPASIKVVEKAGFSVVGYGRKRPRLGVNFLGYYEIERPADSRNHGARQSSESL